MNLYDLKKDSKKEIMQLVSFSIGEEEFGLDILRVQEINRKKSITKIPGTPDFVVGIINLRGVVIPVIDLRTRLGIKTNNSEKDERIIIVELGNTVIGFLVDRVNEVIRINLDTIEPPPNVMLSSQNKMVSAVVKLENRLLLLLNLDEALSFEEREKVIGLTRDHELSEA